MVGIHKILVVDDDQDILELLLYNFQKEGYHVEGTTSPLEALQKLEGFMPQVMIVDIMMHGMNGFELCREIRQAPCGRDISIFFITAGDYKIEQVLETGGDDFIQKFAGLRTLINRVNLVLKRKFVISKRQRTVQIGKWTLDRDQHIIAHQPKQIKLNDDEFELIYFLAQNSKRAIPIKILMDVVSSFDAFRSRQAITQNLEKLALKLGSGLLEFCRPHWVRLNTKP